MEKEEKQYLAWSTWLRCGARVWSEHKNDRHVYVENYLDASILCFSTMFCCFKIKIWRLESSRLLYFSS